jgi:thiamine transport system substrate-binding protein
MLSKRFQEAIPLAMFVFPVNREAALPTEFERYAAVPPNPLELPPAEIGANRERWVDTWTRVVLR